MRKFQPNNTVDVICLLCANIVMIQFKVCSPRSLFLLGAAFFLFAVALAALAQNQVTGAQYIAVSEPIVIDIELRTLPKPREAAPRFPSDAKNTEAVGTIAGKNSITRRKRDMVRSK